MTGVNINKIRHYAPGFNSRTTRLDADAAALVFKAGNKVISRAERLIADVSIKAAMPTSPNTDGKKRGPEDTKSKQYVNYAGIVFDPNGRKKEGSYFKHYVTESERIDALRSENPVPNWGWVNRGDSVNSLPEPRKAVAKVTRYPVNPKTGEPMKTQGFEPEIKALGQTIGEKNPGAKLAARAARAMGLVIDALGKFRCPPGTFAANRFTNERGEGCFGIGPKQVMSIANALTGVMSAPGDKAFLTEALLTIGISAFEIRKEYEANGIAGLASLASRMGIDTGGLVGDAGDGDPSYFSNVVSKVRDVMDATKGSKERMDRVRDEKNKIINDLKSKYGITETDELIALAQIFEAMGKDENAPFSEGQFAKLFMGGSPENHKEWVVAETVKMHMEAIKRKTGLTRPDEVIDEYNRAKNAVPPESNIITNFIDASIKREEKFRIGAFKEILREASIRPETFKVVNGEPFEIIVDPRDVVNPSEGRHFHNLNGVGGESWTYIGSGPAIKGFKGPIPPGYMDLYEATGGDIDDQWRAIISEMDGDEKSRRWVQTYSTDLAAESGNGWEDFGAQTAAHENTHTKQFQAIFQYFKDTRPDENFEEKTNGELWKLVEEFMRTGTPEMMRDVLGVDIEDLIEKRLDALAGQYSQDEQQKALEALQTGNPVAFNRAKNIALLETLAELNANREVGLIGDNPELDEVLDAFMPMYVAPDSVPPGLIMPGAEPEHWGPLIVPGAPEIPGGELIIPGRRPDTPIDAPRPVTPDISPRPNRPLPPSSGPQLPPGAGQTRPSTRPSGQRLPKPEDNRKTKRNSEVARLINNDEFYLDNIDKHIATIEKAFKNIAKMGSRSEDRQIDRRVLKGVVDGMPLSEDELKDILRKIRNGESLSDEEKSKLVETVAYLKEKINEFRHQAELARREYYSYKPDFSDPNRQTRTDIWERKKHYERLAETLGRGLAANVHDILTISENGPYTDRPPSFDPRDRVQPLRTSASQTLSAEEISAIDFVSSNPQNSYLSPSSAPDLADQLYTSVDVSDSFRRHGVTPPQSLDNSDIDNVVPAIKALDKVSIDEDVVVEIEVDLDSDTTPGSIYSIPSIQTAQVVNDDEPRQGLASVVDAVQGRIGAGAASRLLGSRAGRKLIEKAGIDPEQADIVQLAAEMAIGFSAGGPAGLIIPLARRGGRDVGEKALAVMVERGFLEQSVADKIIKHGLDRIASEGLPDEILQAAEATKDKLLTEENKRKALEFGSALQERSMELADAAREKASELADTAKEQAAELAGRAKERASEITGRLGDRWRRRKDRDIEDPFDSIPDPSTASDPFAVDPFTSEAPSVPSVPYNDPFEDVFEEPRTGGLASSSRGAKAASKRITKSFRVDGKPRKKPQTRQELISRAVPTTVSDLTRIIQESPFTQGKKSEAEILDLIRMMDIDWTAQAKLGQKLERVLQDSPGFEELLGEFDVPLMLVTKSGARPGVFNTGQMYQDTTRWNTIEGEYFPDYGFVAFPPRVVNQEEVISAAVDWPMPTDDLIRHELSHTIHAMAMGRSRKARKKYEEDTAEMVDRLEEAIESAERMGLEKIDMSNYALNDRDQELAGMISRYAKTKKSEYIAELMTYMFPGKKTKFFTPMEGHFEMLSEFLDIPIEKLKELSSRSYMARVPFL